MKSSYSHLSQIPLQLGDFQQSDFSTFLVGANQSIIDLIKQIAANEVSYCLYLWGHAATGKSHLLQAACKHASDKDLRVAYIPMEQIEELSPEILHDLGEFDLVCIDDIDFLCGNIEWQQALVWLYNELRDGKHSLLLSAGVAPTNIAIELDDLKSRLSWDQVSHLVAPDDDLKIEILKQNAKARSFELTDEVIDYLMTRVDRDLCSLMQILDQIDHGLLHWLQSVRLQFRL